jgi:hypothetical protein
MIAAALFGVLAQFDPVSLETPVTSAKAVIRSVAETVGHELEVSPALADEVLFIKVDGVDPDALLARIADVTEGAWVQRGDKMVLEPDAPARRKGAEERISAQVAEIMENLGKAEVRQIITELDLARSPHAGGLKGLQAEYDFYHAQVKQIARFVRSIGVRRVAILKTGQRLVFSDNPTRAQERLAGDWNPFVKVVEARKAQGLYLLDEGPMKNPPAALAEYEALYHDIQTRIKPFNGSLKKFLLTIERRGESDSGWDLGTLWADVQAMDENGSLAYVTTMSLDGEELPFGDFASAPEKPFTEPEPKRLLNFSLEDGQLADLEGGEAPGERTADRIMASLTDRDKDPLDLIGGAILRRMAGVGKVNLVANVSDDLVKLREWMTPGKAARATYARLMSEMGAAHLSAEEGEGWLTIKPIDIALTARLDRASLADYAGKGRLQPIDLDARSTFAFRNPGADRNALYQLMNSLMMNATDWDAAMLRFWGSLSAAQRKALRSGEKVTLGSLSEESRRLLRDEIALDGLRTVAPPPPRLADFNYPTRNMIRQMMPDESNAENWVSEPTESLPDGLPLDGTVSVETWTEPCFVADPASRREEFLLTATELISLEGLKPINPEQWTALIGRRSTRSRVGSLTTYGITIRPRAGVEITGQLQDLAVPEDAEVVNVGHLPAGVRASVAKVRAQLTLIEPYLQYRWSGPEFEGGNRNPPPQS